MAQVGSPHFLSEAPRQVVSPRKAKKPLVDSPRLLPVFRRKMRYLIDGSQVVNFIYTSTGFVGPNSGDTEGAASAEAPQPILPYL